MKILVNDKIDSLTYFKNLLDKSEVIKLKNDLEIEPFVTWDSFFSANYWYFKYNLLNRGYIDVFQSEIEDEYYSFFNEKSLNFINMTIIDSGSYQIQFIDGTCYLDILNLDFTITNKNWINLE